MQEFVGTWQRLSREAAASRYPAELTLLPNGQLRGIAETPGEFTLWDVGTWSEPGPGALELSTANDAHVVYQVSLAGDELSFVAPDGTRISYQSTGG